MITRRNFTKSLFAATAYASLTSPEMAFAAKRPSYRGPNIVIIRYGGGVRRLETIGAESYSPYMMKHLAPRATLYPNMVIDQIRGHETSHGQGTINIITGKYEAYQEISNRFLGGVLQPTQPTLFEYFRKSYDIAPHETLIINGENRLEDESLNFGTHHQYGVDFRSEFLSSAKFKTFLYQTQLENDSLTAEQQVDLQSKLAELQKKAVNLPPLSKTPAPILRFWQKWQDYYGQTGFKTPRGDRLTTEMTLWAMRDLKPKMMMVNFQDPDYVHWGIASQYTRAISIIDQGIEAITKYADQDPFYRDNTVFVIVPDCGRDNNPLLDIPFQHHFNSKSAHEIFCMIYGPKIQKNKIITRPTDQSMITQTIAQIMGFKAHHAENQILDEIGG